MPTARGYAAPVTANDGRIYVLGGSSSVNLGSPMTTAEIFDPGTQTWSTGVPLPKARAEFGAALGSDGRIYIAGNGTYNSGACDCSSGALTACADVTTAAFDPQKNAWVATANLNVGRVAPAMVAGHDGRLYVLGGYGAYFPAQNGACQGALGTAEVYTPGIDAWTL
jgi:N-acetylneuraminic acid mutarotase